MKGGFGVCALAIALSLAISTAALADPTPTEIQAARDLFAKAEQDEDAGQWSAALEELRRAATVKATPGLRFHIALCEDKLGQLVPALADYAAALQAARDQNNKEVADAVAEPLKALRARIPMLTITVPEARGTAIDLDGKTIAPGLYGVAIPVEPGMHRVQARANGKRPFTTEIVMKERDAQTATVRWVELVTDGEGEREGAPVHETPEEPPSSSGGGVKVGAIVTTISAAALIGVGIGPFLAADAADGNLRSQCALQLPVDCEGNDLRNQTRVWDAIALGTWIAGGAMTVLTIVLWAKPSHASTSARIQLRPLGVAFTGSF